MKKKGVIISLIVVLLVVILFGGAYLFYSSLSKNKEIDEFSKYIEKAKITFDKLLLNDDEVKYEDLIEQCEKVISSKNNDKIEIMKKKLVDLQDSVEEKNEKTLKDILKEIKFINISEYENKEVIEENIKRADELVSNKKYKKANDIIENIKILIEKDSNKLEESNKDKEQQEAEIQKESEKAANAKVDNNIASRDNVESVIKGFLVNFPEAVNEGDFHIISNYIYPNSSLYNEQKKSIESWYNQGIKEEFLGFTAKDITFSDDRLEGTIISEEVFEITNPSKGSRTESFTWLYKFKYNTAVGNYQITEICKP